MAASFPTTLPAFDEPSDPLNTPLGDNGDGTRTHPEHHRDLGDELIAIATRVGITSSADTNSHDYKITAHLADTTDAHDASAISFVPTGTIAATDVQAAIAEVASEAGGGGISPTLFDANTILKADTDNTPVALTVAASTFLGRRNTGGIVAMTMPQAKAELNLDVSDVTGALSGPFLFNAKGDMLAASAADTAGTLTVGTNGQVLTADSTQTLGVKWATPSSSEATTVSDTASLDLTLTGTNISGAVLPAGVDHNSLANLTTGDPHTQYLLESAQSTNGYVRLDGTSGTRVRAPDSAGLSVTADIDIKVKVAMGDWTPAADSIVCCKFNTSGNQRSFAFLVNGTSLGTLGLYWSTNGTAVDFTGSTVATGFTDGTAHWIRVTMDVVSGANRVTKFYTSDDSTNDADAVSWTQLGTTVTAAGNTSIFDSTAEVAFGGSDDGTTIIPTGNFYAAQIKNGYDGAGSAVASPKFQTGLPYTDTQTNVWTLGGAAAWKPGLDTTLTGEAGKIPQFESDGDLAFGNLTITGSPYTASGGVLRNLSGAWVENTYTQTADPAAYPNEAVPGTPFHVDWNPTLNYVGTALVGPMVQIGHVLGPMAAFQLDGTHTYNFSHVGSPGAMAFQNQTIHRNAPATAITALWGVTGMSNNPWFVANGATVTMHTGFDDTTNGGFESFYDNPVLVTESNGTIDGSGVTLTGYVSQPFLNNQTAGGTINLRRRHAAYVWDIVRQGSGTITINENYGFVVPRMTSATKNRAIQAQTASEFWSDTATFTAAPEGNPLMSTGTHTYNYATPGVPSILVDSRTNIFQQGGQFNGSASFTPTFKNHTSLTSSLGNYLGVVVQPTLTGDTNATTAGSNFSFYANPQFSRVSAGTLTVTDWTDFYSAGTVGTGTTLTTYHGLRVADPTVSGTLTTQYGVNIPRLAAAGTNVGIRCDSPVNLGGDTVTVTANPVPNYVMSVNGSYTISSAADTYPPVLSSPRTMVVDTTLNGFAVAVTFADQTTVKSGANTTNRDLKSVWSFQAAPNVTADQSDDTLATLVGFQSAPIVGVTGAGTPTLAVTSIAQFTASGPTINANATVTTRTGLQVTESTGAGTLTNQYGIDIAALNAGATKDRAIRIAGTTGPGGSIEMGQVTTHDTTTTLPASSGSVYFKGNNFVIAYNDAGTMRFTFTIMTGTITPSVWTHNTTGP